MARIIAGALRGRRLQVPPSGTRPTSDRVREALFSALASHGDVKDAVVLDLYAGSGALGFEALSRGARSLDAVEASPRAAAVIRANVAALGVTARVHAMRVAAFLARPATLRADLVLLDPPYDLDVDQDLAALVAGEWLASGAAVVVERATRSERPAFPVELREVEERRYGDTTLWLSRHVADAD